MSAKWRALTDDDKVPFDKLAKKDKERYDSAMAIYKGKDANKPKRPMSSYFLWLGDFRAGNKEKFAENKDLLRAGEFSNRPNVSSFFILLMRNDISEFAKQETKNIVIKMEIMD